MSQRPSRRRKQSSPEIGEVDVQQAVGLFRAYWPFSLIALIAVIVVAGGVLLYLARTKVLEEATPTEMPDDPRATAVAAPPGSTVTSIGSGASFDGGWYQLYFTAPKYPDNPADHQGGLDAKLVALIDTARVSVDVADYDFDLADVADALVRAKGRGATVRMVTDTDTLTNTKDSAIQSAFDKLKNAGIPIVDDKRGPIMHNKFTVIDQETISTGSWNYTDGDTYHLNNNMIIIHSKDLAANYHTEFEKMFTKKQFGPKKDKAIPNPTATVNGTTIRTCFASEGNCGDLIVSTVRGSTKSIAFMAFSFTSDKIEEAMVDRHAAGVTLGGVFETTGSQTTYSAYTKMKAKKIDVYTDGNPWVMHHKVIIIDDHIVIFGSFNFSDNADTQNDENLLIIDNADIARDFKAEYDRVLALAKNPPVKK